MPSPNVLRAWVEGGYYHVYNRGVAKSTVFERNDDYFILTNLLQSYLTPKPRADKQAFDPKDPFWRSKLEKDEVKLLAYALMPNHFHLLLYQETEHGITRFMKRVIGAYVKYFNGKYDRVGPLFQGRFKAAKIESDEYLLHLSRYIHLNPLELAPRGLDGQGLYDWLTRFEYSSYPAYLGSKDINWVDKKDIFDYFGGNLSRFDRFTNYQQFVESYARQPENILGSAITLDGPSEDSGYTYADTLRSNA